MEYMLVSLCLSKLFSCKHAINVFSFFSSSSSSSSSSSPSSSSVQHTPSKLTCRAASQVFPLTSQNRLHLFIQVFFCFHITKYTLPWQWSLITISRENHWFHYMFPIDHCRLLSIFSRKARWRSSTYNGYLSFDVAFICCTRTFVAGAYDV